MFCVSEHTTLYTIFLKFCTFTRENISASRQDSEQIPKTAQKLNGINRMDKKCAFLFPVRCCWYFRIKCVNITWKQLGKIRSTNRKWKGVGKKNRQRISLYDSEIQFNNEKKKKLNQETTKRPKERSVWCVTILYKR